MIEYTASVQHPTADHAFCHCFSLRVVLSCTVVETRAMLSPSAGVAGFVGGSVDIGDGVSKGMEAGWSD